MATLDRFTAPATIAVALEQAAELDVPIAIASRSSISRWTSQASKASLPEMSSARAIQVGSVGRHS